MIYSQSLLPGAQEIIDKLFPSGWQPFVVQILAMVVLVVAFFIFFFKPVRKIIKKRQDFIENNIKEAEEKRTVADEYLTKAQNEINTAKVKAQDIIVAAQVTAEKEKERILDSTKDEVKALKRAADKDIDESRKKAQDAIKTEIVDVAFMASEKILGREVDEKDNARLVNDFIASLGEDEKK